MNHQHPARLAAIIGVVAITTWSFGVGVASAGTTVPPTDSGVSATSSPAYEEASVTIAVDGFTLGAPVYMAEANGHFDDVSLDVEAVPFQTGFEGIQALTSGQVDFAFGLDFAVVSSSSENIAILGAVASPEPGFHKLAFASGITEPGDLAGGRMGVVAGTAEEYVTVKWLEQNGLDGEVEIVPLPGPFELVGALKTGDIQAAFVWSTAVAEVEKDDNLSIVGDDSDVLQIQGIYLLARTDMVDSNPELVERVLSALGAGADDIAADTPAAAAIVADAVGGDPTAIEGSLDISAPGLAFSQAQLDNLLSIQDFLVTSGAIPEGTNVEASLRLDPARAVAPESIEP